MKEISSERIEISGVEYTLFLNREGLISWEKYTREEKEKVSNLVEKYENTTPIEITDETDPFAGVEEEKEDYDNISTLFRKLYWIMLYTHHKLSLTEVNKLYDEAVKEYGEEQLIELGKQMIDDMNTDKVSKTELKNLTALRPKKK